MTRDFYFHVGTRAYDSENDNSEQDADGTVDTEHQTVLSIDLGVNSLAVASTGTFWQGDNYDQWVREFEKRRAKMQQRGGQPPTAPCSVSASANARGANSTSTPSATGS